MKDLWQAIGTIVAAGIAAIALIRVNRIDNQDKIRRGLWSMETYLFMTGNYIADPTDENKAKYKSVYFICMLYMHEALRDTLYEIDHLFEQKRWKEAENEIIKLTNTYTSFYSMNNYRPQLPIRVLLKNATQSLLTKLKRVRAKKRAN